jgi:hypothetical protein
LTILTHAEVLGYAVEAGWPRPEADIITVIANYESGDDPNAVGDQTLSRYGSIGLTQDFTGAHTPDELGVGAGQWTQAEVDRLKEPLINMKAAYIIYHEQGFTAWSTYNQDRNSAGWIALQATVTKLTPAVPQSEAHTDVDTALLWLVNAIKATPATNLVALDALAKARAAAHDAQAAL